MKTRILLFLASCAFLGIIHSWVLAPVGTLVRQSAAVATVQNSNVAYVAQQAVESGSSLPWFFIWGSLLFLAFFTSPILKALKSPSPTP